MQGDLEEQRAVYKPVAVSAAALYLALGDLPVLSHMYRFSQQMLLSVFQKGLAAAATSADVVMRIAAIQAVRSSQPPRVAVPTPGRFHASSGCTVLHG